MGDEPKRTAKKVVMLPTGTAVADNVKRLRIARGMAITDLSAELDRLGRQIAPLGLRHIESYRRRVDADDLVALAVALEVSPATLLMPDLNTDGTEVRSAEDLVHVTGWHEPVSAGPVWDWIGAEKPLIGTDVFTFYSRAWPRWVRDRVDVIESGVEPNVVTRIVVRRSDGDDQ